MSAETLRKAAALMRERAEAATPGPWRKYGVDDLSEVRQVRDDLTGGRFNRVAACDGWNEDSEDGADDLNAEHIASWHPAVALAVAAWLDDATTLADETGRTDRHALAVARAYLGESA